MNATDLWLRFRALVKPRHVEKELHEELQFHLEMLSRKHAASGLNEAEADWRARAQFGSKAFIADECRDARGIRFLETIWQDVRYAIRSFRRAPMFALTVVGTIALGVGLNAAVFTIFNAYVLRPADVRDARSLYGFTYLTRAGTYHDGLSWPEYQQFERENEVFSEVFGGRKQLVARIDGQVALGQLVTGNYFQVLGIGADLGRMLTPEDSSTSVARPVIVLAHSYWQQHFASDPTVVGRKILVHGYPCEVIGVARSGFNGLDLLPHDFFAPITLDAQLEDGPDLFGPSHPSRIEIVGRLKPGLSVRSAEAALTLWARRLTAGESDDQKATSALLESKATAIPLGPVAATLIAPVATAFGLVLVIACANVANMMLARAMARQREIGIRLSLGAGRTRLIRQLLTESVLLALPAAAAGFAIAHATMEICLRAVFRTLPAESAPYVKLMPLPADVRVLWFSAAAAIASALFFGLVPALQATRASVVRATRGDFLYDVRPARARGALVVVQIAASTLLVVCAAVLLRGTRRVDNVDTGLRTRDVIALDIRESSRERVISALAAEPSALRVAATIPDPPLDARAPRTAISASGTADLVGTRYRQSSPDYFGVFDIPLLAGRNFTEDEARANADVTIVSETAARRLWPNHSPIGAVILIRPDDRVTPANARIRRYPSLRVVGVARDVVGATADDEAERTGIYLPISVAEPGSALIVRVGGDPDAAKRRLDAILTAAAPGSVQQLMSMQTFADFRVYPFRAAYWTSAAVGFLSLLLTISGIYGVLSYLVSQRTKEIGIRMALGTSVRAITMLVLWQSLKFASMGLSVGAVLAIGLSALLASHLSMMNAFDGVAYGGGTLVVLTACIAAAGIPAIRAARVDPIATLRLD